MICDICSDDGFQAEMFGGYHAVLCSDCLNSWSAYLIEHECSKRIIAIDARIAAIHVLAQRGQRNDVVADALADEVERLSVERSAIEKSAFSVARDWVVRSRTEVDEKV